MAIKKITVQTKNGAKVKFSTTTSNFLQGTQTRNSVTSMVVQMVDKGERSMGVAGYAQVSDNNPELTPQP
jgi:hypothetical protein